MNYFDTFLAFREVDWPTCVISSLINAGYENVEEVFEAGEKQIREVRNIGPKSVKLIFDSDKKIVRRIKRFIGLK